MAVKDYELLEVTPTTIIVKWSSLQNGDTGNPLPVSQWGVSALSVSGVQGTGGVLTLELAQETSPVFWKQTTPFGVYPSYLEPNIIVNGAFRPNITSGDGTTSLTMVATLLPYGKNI